MRRTLVHLQGRIRSIYSVSGPAGLLLTATIAALLLCAAVVQGS